jgi:hypothetical protein
MMPAIDLILELDGFCIETTAKRAHRRLMEHLLEAPEQNPEQEARLQLLGDFLQQEDFQALRASDLELTGGSAVRVRLSRDEAGRVVWEKLVPAAQ